MKEIELSKGYITLVDDEDFEYLNQWKWLSLVRNNCSYAIRREKVNGKIKVILMHNLIMPCRKGVLIDHKDRNSLNNQKLNLRFCNHKQNCANRTPCGKSKYLGVYISIYVGKKHKTISYRADITISRKTVHLGRHRSEIDAAKAYDKAAKIHHGEFANLNFPEM